MTDQRKREESVDSIIFEITKGINLLTIARQSSRGNLHQRDHHRARRRSRRPAAAGDFDSDGSGGFPVRALQGARGRQGAPATSVLARGLQGAGDAAGALRGPPSHSGATHKGDARLHVIPLFISHCS